MKAASDIAVVVSVRFLSVDAVANDGKVATAKLEVKS